ncbi:cupin domain-containing protein [Paradesertivirga mongoliensis]|uniref:Cupin domain-containing protein n=1 Tax=Paradesertivirga mongoliensis TaxID=2100740 RepID=A0ABW4ZIY8_9SPHI|nr:cupin domain-containing protein [Pedobacter mongoliensis]
MNYTACYFVNKLGLQAHPEGGYFAETYRSVEQISSRALPSRFIGDRNISTAIYFLLEGHQFSAFHRIKSDELWHFYYGIPLMVYIIHPDGQLETLKIGNDPEESCLFQGTVKAGCWFASKPINESGFSLVGCTVAPGFDFNDFELANEELIQRFPQHGNLIAGLIR